MASQDVQKELFINVYGYSAVKQELMRIKDWLTDESLRNNDKIMLPKGVCFYGRPGCGKTLMLREYAKSFNAPTFVVDGESENVAKEIIDKFKQAREEKFALVLIDEVDELIEKNCRAERALQQELDGINTKGSILVLVTTNNLHRLSDALTRPGRFDRLIEFDFPDRASRKEIIQNFVKDLKIDDSNIDFDHVAKVCSRCSVAHLKAVCNDAFLRCKENITTEDIEVSYKRIVHQEYENNSSNFKDFRVAIHEVGHFLTALHFKENFTAYNALFNATGGYTEVQEVDERTDTVEKREQGIMIAMGGYIAEEVFFGNHDVGSFSDYSKIQDQCQRLIERVCVKGIRNLVPIEFYENLKHWNSKLAKRNRRLTEKLVKKYEKQTRKFLVAHKAELETYAKKMFDTGIITYKDCASLVI